MSQIIQITSTRNQSQIIEAVLNLIIVIIKAQSFHFRFRMCVILSVLTSKGHCKYRSSHVLHRLRIISDAKKVNSETGKYYRFQDQNANIEPEDYQPWKQEVVNFLLKRDSMTNVYFHTRHLTLIVP